MAHRFPPLLRHFLPRVRSSTLTTLRTQSAAFPSAFALPAQKRLFQNFTARLAQTKSLPSLPKDASISNKLKHLIKVYGWYALGVHLVISALDFGFTFTAIYLLGAEQVSALAASVKTSLYGFFNSKPPGPDEEIETASDSGSEGLYAMLAVAFTIHKLILPLRFGLTVSITPPLVNFLRLRGWAGSAGTRRAAEVCLLHLADLISFLTKILRK